MIDHRSVCTPDDVEGILRVGAEAQGALDAVLEGDPHAEQIDVEVAGPFVVGDAVGYMVYPGCLPAGRAGPCRLCTRRDLAVGVPAAGGGAGEDARLRADLGQKAVVIPGMPGEIPVPGHTVDAPFYQSLLDLLRVEVGDGEGPVIPAGNGRLVPLADGDLPPWVSEGDRGLSAVIVHAIHAEDVHVPVARFRIILHAIRQMVDRGRLEDAPGWKQPAALFLLPEVSRLGHVLTPPQFIASVRFNDDRSGP